MDERQASVLSSVAEAYLAVGPGREGCEARQS